LTQRSDAAATKVDIALSVNERRMKRFKAVI